MNWTLPLSSLRGLLFVTSLLCSVSACDDGEETRPEPSAGAEPGAGALAGTLAGTQAGSAAGAEGAVQAGTQAGSAGGGAEGRLSYEGVTLNELSAKGEPSDWLELYNHSSEERDLSGCGLSDDPSELFKGLLPEGSLIPAGGFLLVAITDETLGFKLGDAEQLTLSSPSGELIDEVSYSAGQSPVGGSYGRLPDGVGAWETLYSPSPSAPNERGEAPSCGDLLCEPAESAESCPEDCVSCGDGLCDPSELGACEADCPSVMSGVVVINEVVAAGSPDWLELYNLSDEDIDLSGYGLSDELTAPFKATLSGLTLPASGHLKINVSDESLGFKLGGDELASLTDPSGLVLDLVDWDEGDAPEGMSWGRSPDGAEEWRTQAPSPGAANVSP